MSGSSSSSPPSSSRVRMYDSYAAAQRRVEVIRAALGVCPGITGPACVHKGCQTTRCRHYDEQRWWLTYDPESGPRS